MAVFALLATAVAIAAAVVVGAVPAPARVAARAGCEAGRRGGVRGARIAIRRLRLSMAGWGARRPAPPPRARTPLPPSTPPPTEPCRRPLTPARSAWAECASSLTEGGPSAG